MWILMIMLVLVGWALTGVKLSLMKVTSASALAVVTALIPLACYRLSLGLNTREVALVVADYRVMTTIATIAVVESLAVTILSIELMREHYGARPPRRLTMLIRLPSAVFVAGLVASQTILFNSIPGQTFTHMAAMHAGVALATAAVGGIGARVLIRSWIGRVDLMVVLAFFQLILAMFLPVIAAGLDMPETQFAVDPGSALTALGSMFIVTAAGFVLGRLGLLPGKGFHQ